MNNFKPIDHQPKLNTDQFIIKEAQVSDESVPMDVTFVGAGPAGLAGAIELARLIKKDTENGGTLGDIEIGVLEKAANLGGHNLSGAVINPRALKELFPELKIEDFPFKNKVESESVYYMTGSGKIPMPTPPPMHNKGNYTASICEVVRWLGKKAEDLGVNVFTSFPADSLLTKDNKVIGVRTTPSGLNKDGSPGSQHMPATDITSEITILTEGTRGPLAQAYTDWQNISSKYEQIYALGVKELWKVKKMPKEVIHTLGWPLPKSAFGGSWMYPMGEDHISFGLVVGLDYKNHNTDVHNMLQELKEHPLFKQYLDGGECIEWGAKTIPEGGLNALPDRLFGDGLLIAGDCAGFVNVPALKGIHYAMQTGMYAARTAFKALKEKSYTAETLKDYQTTVENSYVFKDLKKVRNMRQAFKSGFVSGGVKAGLMTVTGGAFPGDMNHCEEDAADPKTVSTDEVTYKGISKVDAVYKSGNKTRDDIPSHLTIGKDIPADVAKMYVHMCPAGVYEQDGDKLIVNAPNCVDCKATDVIGPRWQPREGGAGPDYTEM